MTAFALWIGSHASDLLITGVCILAAVLLLSSLPPTRYRCRLCRQEKRASEFDADAVVLVCNSCLRHSRIGSKVIAIRRRRQMTSGRGAA